jgi:predicted DNA binding CopG/RHH family protein
MKKEYDLKRLKKRAEKARSNTEAAKVQISLRVDGSDLAALKSEGERLGIPYQTLLGSIIHQYVTGEFVEKKTVALLKKLQSA